MGGVASEGLGFVISDGFEKVQLYNSPAEIFHVGFPQAMALDDLGELFQVMPEEFPPILAVASAVAQFVVEQGAAPRLGVEEPQVVRNNDLERRPKD